MEPLLRLSRYYANAILVYRLMTEQTLWLYPGERSTARWLGENGALDKSTFDEDPIAGWTQPDSGSIQWEAVKEVRISESPGKQSNSG